MVLFPLFSLPLATLALISFSGYQADERKKLIFRMVKGIVLALPALLLMIVIRNLWTVSYRPGPHFFYLLITENCFPFVIPITGILIWDGPDNLQKTSLLEYLITLTGFHFVLTCYELIIRFGQYDPFTIFLHPVLRLIFIIYMAFLAVKWAFSYGIFRIGLSLALLALPFAITIITYLYFRSHGFVSFLLGGIILAGGVAFWAVFRTKD